MTNTLQPQPLPRLDDGFVELDCGPDRAYEFAPAEPGRVLVRQHAVHLEPGGPHLSVANSGTAVVIVCNAQGRTIGEVEPGGRAELFVALDETGARSMRLIPCR